MTPAPRAEGQKRRLALIAILAAGYITAAVALGTISYGPLNLRFANVLIGVVPVLGLPAVTGIALGVLLANVASPLGPIDLLSVFPSLLGLYAVYLLRNRTVAGGLAIYAVVLSLWVTFELSFVLGLAYFPLYWAVLAGLVVVNIPAYFLHKGIKRRLP